MSKSDLIDVTVQLHHETDRAVLVSDDGDRDLLAAVVAEARRADVLIAALEFYANPAVYAPHPHGPALDPMFCEQCHRNEHNPIMLDTETCSQCGGYLTAIDDYDEDGQPTEQQEWNDYDPDC